MTNSLDELQIAPWVMAYLASGLDRIWGIPSNVGDHSTYKSAVIKQWAEEQGIPVREITLGEEPPPDTDDDPDIYHAGMF